MGLLTASGTRLNQAGFTSRTTAVTGDPEFTVNEDIYEEHVYPGESGTFPPDGRKLRFAAGSRVRQSQIDALFADPTIATVAPATGPAAGGTTITITGTNFSPDATVTVGGTAATAVQPLSATQVRCTTPPGTAGAKNVVVTSSGGTATSTGGYTYT